MNGELVDGADGVFRFDKMHLSPTNRMSLKREAYRSYFSTFSIFLGGGRRVHFVTPDGVWNAFRYNADGGIEELADIGDVPDFTLPDGTTIDFDLFS